MAEKNKPLPGTKPVVPMKLFATWEASHRTPPNCIPRLCSFTLTRLVITTSLGSEVSSIFLAVKMQGSKRTLRSNEIALPPGGLLDTELQLNFSLQYPHFIKNGNKLHVMLQRRKRYKNRTILGYKTLADSVINMTQILQKQMDMDLDLIVPCKDSKGGNILPARVSVTGLSSQPIDYEVTTKSSGERSRRVGRLDNFSDEEEDFSTNDEGSDSEPMLEEHRVRKSSIPQNTVRQRNLKQKFISLIRKFRINEGLNELDPCQDAIGNKLSGGEMDPEIEDLFEELDLSDSEMDTTSVTSTPKPSLRPFFSSSRNLLHETHNVPDDSNSDTRVSDESPKVTDYDSPPESSFKRSQLTPDMNRSSLATVNRSPSKKTTCCTPPGGFREVTQNVRDKKETPEKMWSNRACSSPFESPRALFEGEPRDSFMETLHNILPSDNYDLPTNLILVNINDPLGSAISEQLKYQYFNVLPTSGPKDVRAAVTYVTKRIRKWLKNKQADLISQRMNFKFVAIGSSGFFHCIFRNFLEITCETLAKKPNLVKFFLVPLRESSLCRLIGSVDKRYFNYFIDGSWNQLLHQRDISALLSRLLAYVETAERSMKIPISEAVLVGKQLYQNKQSSSFSVPFLSELKLVFPDDAYPCLESDECVGFSSSPNSSLERNTTPPPAKEPYEEIELVVDCWSSCQKTDVKSDGSRIKADLPKYRLKNHFRHVQVNRYSGCEEHILPYLTLSFTSREIKQKMMSFVKKKEIKSYKIDDLAKLEFSPKSQGIQIRVLIDGTEYFDVKSFEVNSQWNFNIRSFPVATFHPTD